MNSEQLQKWSSISEIVSGITIIITLVFLLLEMRSNTEAVQAQTRQATTEGVRQITLAIATNPGLAELLFGEAVIESASPAQRTQMVTWFTAWLKSAEEAYLQYRSGLLDEEIWLTRKANLFQLLIQPKLRYLYDNFAEGTLVAAFKSMVDSELDLLDSAN